MASKSEMKRLNNAPGQASAKTAIEIKRSILKALCNRQLKVVVESLGKDDWQTDS